LVKYHLVSKLSQSRDEGPSLKTGQETKGLRSKR
jgi:hypothetical protein